MTLSKIFYLLCSALYLHGCKTNATKNDFYSYTKSFDLWRFPLIEPIELISTTNAGEWFLVLPHPKFQNPDFFSTGEFQLSAIETVGLQDSIILVHSSGIYWPKLGGMYNTTVIINSKTKMNYIYSDQHHAKILNEKLKELGAMSIKLYPLSSLLKSFQADLSLPEEWPH